MWPTARCGAGRATFAAALAAVCLLGGSGRPVRPHPPARELPTSPVSFRAGSRSALSGRAAHRVPAAASTQLVSCRSLRPCRPAGPHLHPQTHQHPPARSPNNVPGSMQRLAHARGHAASRCGTPPARQDAGGRECRRACDDRGEGEKRAPHGVGYGWGGSQWKRVEEVEGGGTQVGVQVSTGFRFGGA